MSALHAPEPRPLDGIAAGRDGRGVDCRVLPHRAPIAGACPLLERLLEVGSELLEVAGRVPGELLDVVGVPAMDVR